MERATSLLLDIVGGEAGPIIEVVSENDLPKIAPVTLRAERINQMLGLEMDGAEVVRLLASLGLEVTEKAKGRWQVGVPSHRFDISLGVDLIEELGRLCGYDQIGRAHV